ncbi:MAG: type II secretion system protein [Phycisphaerales bacterium]|jgi:prepilin-type N-terminal cleavage/methylation domain-containing protein|nr:type II secretion system protein [Phycisphaerales bacterium]
MPSRRGFTMIEIIVVTVMAAMLAVLLVSRLTGARTREFDLAADRVGDLLLMYAIRSEFADEPVGISMDPDRNSLRLLVRRGERDDAFDGWTPDLSVTEIRLPEFIRAIDMEFLADGDQVNPADKPLTSLPGQPRPRVDVTMQRTDAGNARTVRFSLPSNGWRPIRTDSMRDEPVSAISRTPVDLDMSGQWQEDW